MINLAWQKQYITRYHMGLHDGPLLDRFRAEWPRHTSARWDMGKCCVRFRKPSDIPLRLVGELASKVTPAAWVATYERARATSTAGGAKSTAAEKAHAAKNAPDATPLNRGTAVSLRHRLRFFTMGEAAGKSDD